MPINKYANLSASSFLTKKEKQCSNQLSFDCCWSLLAYSVYSTISVARVILYFGLRCEITLVNFIFQDEAKRMTHRLKLCRGQYVLQVIYGDGSKLKTEQFDQDTISYLSNKFVAFKHRKNKTTWWKFIWGDFLNFFSSKLLMV